MIKKSPRNKLKNPKSVLHQNLVFFMWRTTSGMKINIVRQMINMIVHLIQTCRLMRMRIGMWTQLTILIKEWNNSRRPKKRKSNVKKENGKEIGWLMNQFVHKGPNKALPSIRNYDVIGAEAIRLNLPLWGTIQMAQTLCNHVKILFAKEHNLRHLGAIKKLKEMFNLQ